jgi:ferredoxin-NADP reductase/uncharacterized protein YcbX
MSTIQTIYRYPLKGFSGQCLESARLEVRRGLPYDRHLALTNGEKAVEENGQWTACQAFVRLTKNASLPLYKVAFDEQRLVLELQSPKGERLNIKTSDKKSISNASATLDQWLPSRYPKKTQLMQAQLGYWDHADAEISLINLATTQALSLAADVAIDPLRFRGNLYLQGLEAQSELAWLGKRIRIGQAELEITRPIDRCSATSLDPKTGLPDVNMPALLARQMGHIFCGLYARVIKPGLIKAGDSMELIGATDSYSTYYHPKTAPPAEQWPRFAEVMRCENEDRHVKSFWLRDPLAALRTTIQAGQHIRIHMQEGQRLMWRAYTVSDVEGDLLRISVKRSAASQGGSAWLHDRITLGSQVLMSGAFGEFTAPQLPKHPLIFLSAGIGITPIVAMIKNLVAQKTEVRIVVLHACNSIFDLALWNELKGSVAKLPNATAKLFIKEATISQYQSLQAAAGQMSFEEVAREDLKTFRAYMCGPATFMAFAQERLVATGMMPERIHREVFSTPSAATKAERTAPDPGPFRVRFLRQKIDVTWQPNCGSLLELAELHGLKPNANCRSGACMTCLRKVPLGKSFHTLEPSMPLAENTCLICCAVPQSDIEIDL